MLLKLQWNKKYTTIAVYACIVILFTIMLVNFMIRQGTFDGIFTLIGDVIAPIVYGLVIAYILNPIMRFFEKKVFRKIHPDKKRSKLRRAFALTSTYISFLAVITLFLWILLPQFVDSLTGLITSLIDYVSKDLMTDIRGILDFNEALLKAFNEFASDFDLVGKLSSFGSELVVILDFTGKMLASIFIVLKNLLLGLFFSIYFLASKETLMRQVRRLMLAIFNDKAMEEVSFVYHVINEKFGQFIRGKVIDSSIVMMIVYLLCWIFGIPYYPMIAVVIGITDLIPVFGPFLGAIPSAVIILIAEGGGIWKAITFALIILVVQQIDGNILAPFILGDKVGLEGVWIMTAVVVMGGLFGVVGMFFGVPIFAVIYTILGHWIHVRLVKKGLDPDVEPEPPPPEEVKLFGIPLRRKGEPIKIEVDAKKPADENNYDDDDFFAPIDKDEFFGSENAPENTTCGDDKGEEK